MYPPYVSIEGLFPITSGFTLQRAFSRCIGLDGVPSFVAIIEFGFRMN